MGRVGCYKLSWRKTQPYAVVSTAIVNIFFGGDPYGAFGMGMWWAGWTHVGAATGAFGGAPYRATNPVSGALK